jgi:hypothetical protein
MGMSKPEDIPEDVWGAAHNAILAAREYSTTDRDVWAACIARAIMAAKAEQREADAQVVFNTPPAVEHPSGPLYGAGWAAAVQLITAAIRKGGAA